MVNADAVFTHKPTEICYFRLFYEGDVSAYPNINVPVSLGWRLADFIRIHFFAITYYENNHRSFANKTKASTSP